MTTEQEMREETAPTFDSVEELQGYINSLVDRQHDYGTCVYAMSLAATAAFNFVARRLGVTGFQASCAGLDIIRRTRRMDCPFVIITARDELYPQYDNAAKLKECQASWRPWLAEEAKKMLAESGGHPDVVARWKELAAQA